MLEVEVFALVQGALLPMAARPRSRRTVPTGYGVQEQCLPFTAASALGYLIPSPITFGLSTQAEVPEGAIWFRSPVKSSDPEDSADDRVFYVVDAPERGFSGNAHHLVDLPAGRAGKARVEPGISFFERSDQTDLFKVHLPYIVKTSPGIDTLFSPPINRPSPLQVLAGLVETDWYANPVNLVIRKPPAGQSVHIHAGRPLAQAALIRREDRRVKMIEQPTHSRATRDALKALMAWYKHHELDRSAYKTAARSRQERL